MLKQPQPLRPQEEEEEEEDVDTPLKLGGGLVKPPGSPAEREHLIWSTCQADEETSAGYANVPGLGSANGAPKV